ncbi:beta-N-acetylhexosaminidase [Marininema mesophilum]|uniref:beta-N-acetylhexosaminidase n=1 Tax=Marininema mesophilum TaxID=1048340 RepID=A0A1H2SH48_9BACL|nr:glycoside hydrolase family 3 protein [Marininema mesophilum]SDW30862.1 beta-N-acetylhexosaminidase [Marininema mesophilum]
MKSRRVMGTIVSLFLVCSLFIGAPMSSAEGHKRGDQGEQSVERVLKRMTVEEKVGQMMMVGFKGSEPTEEIRNLIQRTRAGSVILFAWSENVKEPVQVANLTNGLQEIAAKTRLKVPLLISTDQEGGVVARLTQGAMELPGNMALGAARSSKGAYDAARFTANELRAIGVNMNLAPDLDVNVNPANPVIGVRSFGENPSLVADLGEAAIKGYQRHGVIATAKHFPGHGDTAVDSHLGLPEINKPRAELEKVEFVPFKRAIQSNIDAIMTAHIHVPALDSTPELPATLSKPILTDLLRKEMGYKGIIITDSMTMAGVSDTFGGVPKASVKAVQAGADIVLLTPELTSGQQMDVYNELVAAVHSGAISEKRINDSVRRIIKVKRKYGLFEHRQVDVKRVPERVGTPKHKNKAMQLARKSITLVKNKNQQLPLKLQANEKLGIISQYSIRDYVLPYHANTTEIHQTKVSPTDSEIAQAVEMARGMDRLIVGTYSASLYPQQVKLVQELSKLGKPITVVAFRNPYDIMKFPEVDAYVTAYGFRSVSIKAAVDTLFGANSPRGKLPVTIPGLYEYGHGLKYVWKKEN